MIISYKVTADNDCGYLCGCKKFTKLVDGLRYAVQLAQTKGVYMIHILIEQ